MDPIDWGVAQRIGERVAGSPPRGGVRAASVEPVAYEFARRVADYSGLPAPTELPPLEAVERPAWIAANLSTMRPMLAPLGERMSSAVPGPLAAPLRSVSGFLLGAQVGALTGLLSQRVLGQYDLALLDSTVPPRLLLVAPNLALTARSLGVDREELVLWVSIHEITHAVQFAAAPWLRDHLGGMLKELIEGLQVSLAGRLWARPRMPQADELRTLLERARRGELLRVTLGEDRWQVVERIQSTMSLIEGHAEHTMDAVGAEVIPTLPRLRAALNRRRESRGLPWRVLERLLGLELKLRQYQIGRNFCDAVVSARGPQILARAWSGPEALPTSEELRAPRTWITRTDRADEPGRTHVPPVTK